jgi:hypothetical protein
MADCSRRLCCDVNSALLLDAMLQQDICGVKQEPELSAVESSSFSEEHLISVKQEAEGDAKVS